MMTIRILARDIDLEIIMAMMFDRGHGNAARSKLRNKCFNERGLTGVLAPDEGDAVIEASVSHARSFL